LGKEILKTFSQDIFPPPKGQYWMKRIMSLDIIKVFHSTRKNSFSSRIGENLRIQGMPDKLYCYKKDIPNNILYACKRDSTKLKYTSFYVDNINWIHESYKSKSNFQVKVRSTQINPLKCKITLENNKFLVNLTNNEFLMSISPGQIAVFYDNDVCLGGGMIV
jgi:tRNA U34 2-thiouridine synthase MnmA/TrmU